MSTTAMDGQSLTEDPSASDQAYEFHVIPAADDATHHHETGTMLGFWLYLMSDCLIFGALFAVHAVIGGNYAGGPRPSELFEIHLILIATFMLLFSSITYGFAMISMQAGSMRGLIGWLIVTALFGLGFLSFELYEFHHLWHIGATPGVSAFLSSFWTLVGTHGLHVTFGIVWLVVLLFQLNIHGITPENKRRVMCLSLFWHFLDLIWIGVFSYVYLAGFLL
ncbi:MAG: cytochrome o ubiquinol oxidase subunit III [Pseudomonadota bacterium]